MSYYLIAEILLTFLFTQFFLNHYVTIKKINFVTVVSVFICFCFSFLTIIILPSDIASTFYRQCAASHNQTDDHPVATTTVAALNASQTNYNLNNLNEINDESGKSDESIDKLCSKPFDYVKPQVLQIVWNIIYWTNFILTCFLLRVLSSFSVSGQFFFKKKLKEFFHNFYYELALYLVFGLSLLIYLVYALSINVTEFISVRALISSLNNIYSLINLTILLGIGLVKVPSIFFRKSSYESKLNYYLFKIAKQRERLVLADCEFEDCLDEIKKVNDVLKNGPQDRKLSYCLREIIKQTPEDFQKNIDTRVIYTENTTCPSLSEEKLVKLNRKFKEVNNTKVRLEALTGELADKTIELEEVIQNENEPTRKYVSYNNHYKSERYLTTLFKRFIFVPKVEWYFKCLIVKNFYYYLSYFLIVLSAFLFFSELFHSLNLKSLVPVHLGFKLLDYFNLNLILKVYIIALLLYISVTAYHTLFTLNLFGYFKLTSNQQTDEYSLIFCTRYICSLSPAIALNMFNLIGLDYQSENKIRPSYTAIMGRLIFLNKLNDFLYFLFPAILCLLSFFTFFNLTDKILHMLGYERFTVQDEITTALIEDGKKYLEKEKKQRLRHSKSTVPKQPSVRKVEREESQRDLLNSPSTNESTPQSTSIDIVVQDDARQSDNSTSKPNYVNKNLFDDV